MDLLSTLYEQRLLTEATRRVYQALQRTARREGPLHPETALQMNRLATLYKARGQKELADHLFDQALHILELNYGRAVSPISSALNYLGGVCYVKAAPDQVAEVYPRALCIPVLVSRPSLLNERAYGEDKTALGWPIFKRVILVWEEHPHPDSACLICTSILSLIFDETGLEEFSRRIDREIVEHTGRVDMLRLAQVLQHWKAWCSGEPVPEHGEASPGASPGDFPGPSNFTGEDAEQTQIWSPQSLYKPSGDNATSEESIPAENSTFSAFDSMADEFIFPYLPKSRTASRKAPPPSSYSASSASRSKKEDPHGEQKTPPETPSSKTSGQDSAPPAATKGSEASEKRASSGGTDSRESGRMTPGQSPADLIAQTVGEKFKGDTLQNLHHLIPPKSRRRIIQKLFGGSQAEYEAFIHELNQTPTWKEASRKVEHFFSSSGIDPYHKVALEFSGWIYRRYFPKDKGDHPDAKFD